MAHPKNRKLRPVACQELMLRHDAGEDLDKLRARFGQAPGHLARILSIQLKRRADAWARDAMARP